VSRKQC